MSELKSLKSLLALAVAIENECQTQLEAGGFMLQPVFHNFKNARVAVERRIFQIESIEAEQASNEAISLRDANIKAAADKAKADRAAFEANAIARAEYEQAEEMKNRNVQDVNTARMARDKYSKKSIEELLVLAGKRNINDAKNARKSKVINLLMQADGLIVTQAEQEAADHA